MAPPSKAVALAKARRKKQAANKQAKLDIQLDKIKNNIVMPMGTRVKLAVEFLKSKVVHNISIPVEREGNRVVQRSVPGEFPRADTTMLMKTIFGEVTEKNGVYDGFVGTPLDYGARLELDISLDRRYLQRTFWECHSQIMDILTGPLK